MTIVPCSLLRHFTLPHKMRRATGFSGAGRKVAYEDAEINTGKSAPKPTPSPVHGSLPPMPRKHRESSPQLPTPYQPKKRLSASPSAGDLMEQNQLGRPLSGSHLTSSNSSLTDNELDNYEPVTHFLLDPLQQQKGGGDGGIRISLGGSSSDGAGGGGASSASNRTSSSSFNAPSYPAPLPPKHETPEISQSKSKSLGGAEDKDGSGKEEDEEDDDGYEPVKVEGGQVSIQSSYGDEVERAQLPLLSSSSTPRSSLAGDSSHNSPMKSGLEGGPKSSPRGSLSDLLSPQKLSTSPRDRAAFNEGAARYLANVKASRSPVMPPEPTTPPPSPPTKARQLEKDIKAPSGEVQPKLPPKKRSQKTQQLVQPSSSPDTDIYSFDRLDSSTGSPQTGNFQPPGFFQPPTPSSVTANISYDDSNVYEFDSLEKAPLPSRPPKPENYSMAKPISSHEVDDSNVYEFDRLDKPPVIPKKLGPGRGAKLKSSQSFNVQSSSSAMSSSFKLTGKMPVHEAPPTILPRKPDPPTSPYQFHDDANVYEFDSLEPETPNTLPQATPTMATSLKGASEQMHDDSDIYEFDTLQAKEEQPRVNETGKDTLSPETGQVRKGNSVETYSMVPSSKLAPKAQSPALPPKSSPPALRSKLAEVSGI